MVLRTRCVSTVKPPWKAQCEQRSQGVPLLTYLPVKHFLWTNLAKQSLQLRAADVINKACEVELRSCAIQDTETKLVRTIRTILGWYLANRYAVPGVLVIQQSSIDKRAIGIDFIQLPEVHVSPSNRRRFGTNLRTILSFALSSLTLPFPLAAAIRISAPSAVSACSTLPTLYPFPRNLLHMTSAASSTKQA
jgi:hypothetical protein